jgi:hypothetical protein
MMFRKPRSFASPRSVAFYASLGLLALLGLPLFLRAAATGPAVYPNRLCPGGAAAACYYCNGNPSPLPYSAGCTNGNPSGWLFGACDTKTYSEFDCSEKTLGCGDNLSCTAPFAKVGTCTSSNLLCSN